MKKYFLLVSLLAIALFVMPVTIWSRTNLVHNVYTSGIPPRALNTANDWMAENALPYTRIHPTYTNLGKGLWEIRWTWQVASGIIYDATLLIKSNGQLMNEPIIEELADWPY
jgi:hypothetical protein